MADEEVPLRWAAGLGQGGTVRGKLKNFGWKEWYNKCIETGYGEVFKRGVGRALGQGAGQAGVREK